MAEKHIITFELDALTQLKNYHDLWRIDKNEAYVWLALAYCARKDLPPPEWIIQQLKLAACKLSGLVLGDEILDQEVLKALGLSAKAGGPSPLRRASMGIYNSGALLSAAVLKKATEMPGAQPMGMKEIFARAAAPAGLSRDTIQSKWYAIKNAIADFSKSEKGPRKKRVDKDKL